MRKNDLMRRIILGCILGLGPIGAAVARDYQLIVDPSLVGKGAGLDGLWGTGDTGEGDITDFFPGANPAGAASFSFDTSNFDALTFFSGVDTVADPIAPVGQSSDVTALSYSANNVLGIASTTTLDPSFTSTVTSTGLMSFSSNTHVFNTVTGSLSFLTGVGIVLFNDGLRDDPSLVLSDPELITAANFLKGLVDASHPDWTAITFEMHCTSTVGCTQGTWTHKFSSDAAAMAPIPAGVNQSGSIFMAATNTPFVGSDAGGGLLALGVPTATQSYEALIIGTEAVGNKGAVAVSGMGASLTSDSGIVVGERGDGRMRVSDGAVVQIDGNAGPFGGGPIGLTIANAGGSAGQMEVLGAGSVLSVTGPVIVADGSAAPGFGIPSTASGTLLIDDGGQMNVAGSVSLGYTEFGNGTLTVSGGAGTAMAFQGPDRALDVGLNGTGLLQVTDSAAVTGALFLDVGTLAGATGTLQIEGSGTHVDLTGVCNDCAANSVAPGTGPYLWVGLQGNGSVTIADGATLTIDPDNGGAPLPNGSGFEVGGSSFAAGGPLTGTGELGVHGGSVLEVRGSTGYFSVGDGGTGALMVSDGGQVILGNPDGLASGYIATTGDSSGTVQVQGAGSLLNAGSFLAAGLDFNLADSGGDATLEVGSGGTIAADTIQLGTSAILRGSGGTLLGNLLNGGTVAPGASPGTITVDGDYSQLPGGRLVIEIGGLTPGIDFDVLDVTGTASLGGTLKAVLINGFVPQFTDVFQFLLAGSIEGGFSNLIFPIFNGRTFALDLSSGSLAVEAVPLPPALWLLVSAMLGLIGIGRRQAKQRCIGMREAADPIAGGGRMHLSIQLAESFRTREILARGMYALGIIIIVSAMLSAPAKATVLTFDVDSNFNGTSIPSGYGDNVDQSVVAGVSYLEGNGWTPDITVEFLPDFGSYSHWASGYANTAQGVTLLPHALGHSSFNVPGEIVFTPSSGKRVSLTGFDIGTWLQGSYVTDIRVWDDFGTRANPNLFAFNATLNPGIVYRPLTQALAASGPLHLYINNLGSTGIDNIYFTQNVSVPPPAAVWLLGSALVWLGALGRRHSSGSDRGRHAS